jgi:hypothetical protein
VAMAGMAGVGHLTGGHLQRGKQRRGAPPATQSDMTRANSYVSLPAQLLTSTQGPLAVCDRVCLKYRIDLS